MFLVGRDNDECAFGLQRLALFDRHIIDGEREGFDIIDIVLVFDEFLNLRFVLVRPEFHAFVPAAPRGKIGLELLVKQVAVMIDVGIPFS